MTGREEPSRMQRWRSAMRNSRLVRLFRTHLSVRLALMFVAVAVIPMVVGASLSYQYARKSLVDLALSKVEQEATLTAKDMETFLGQFSTDVLALSKSPPVQGIIRARDHEGIDPLSNESYESWIDRLRQIFATTARSKEFYRSLAFLDETGDEIVRVDYRDGKITIFSEDTRLEVGMPLQNRAGAIYFGEARVLESNDVYISPLRLSSRENDEVEQPHVPIIHFSTPIHDQEKQFRGVVVSSVYAASFLDRLSVDRGQVYLANQEGFYLVHPDPSRAFGFDLGSAYNVSHDFSATYEALLRSNRDAHTTLDSDRAEVVALQKLHFDPRRPERYWLLIRALPEGVVLGPVKLLRILVLGVALIVILIATLLALRLARRFTRPIKELTGVAEHISRTDLPRLVESMGQVAAGEPVTELTLQAQPIEINSEDEIGQLGTAFNHMTASLQEAEPRLLKTQEQLRLQKEAAEVASRAKSEFLSNMSHELRTPLNSILGYAQILRRREELSDLEEEGLSIIQQSGEHLLTLINDILDLSKIEARKMEIYATEFHLPNFLQVIARIIQMRAREKGIRFTYEPTPLLPSGVSADEKRLRQVLINLLGNAVKFTDEGRVIFRVAVLESWRQRDGEYYRIRFEVEDTGVGMSPDQLERAFMPFEQVGEARHQVEGTGLGLTISRKLVQMMGSEIQVKSEPGKGSTFWFDLEIPTMAAEIEEQELLESDVLGYIGPQRKVLVADDELTNRSVLLNLLAPLGFEVIQAENGQIAVAKAREEQPDVILMDLAMPVMTGFEATQAIRQIEELRDVAIVATTARVFDTDQQQSIEAGCDAFLPKPLKRERLLSLLGELLELEWRYSGSGQIAERATPAPTAKEGEEVSLVVPPPEEMQTLYQLAMYGDIRGIRDYATHLEQMGQEFTPFASRLQELARGFQEKAILTFVRQYMDIEVQ